MKSKKESKAIQKNGAADKVTVAKPSTKERQKPAINARASKEKGSQVNPNQEVSKVRKSASTKGKATAPLAPRPSLVSAPENGRLLTAEGWWRKREREQGKKGRPAVYVSQD